MYTYKCVNFVLSLLVQGHVCDQYIACYCNSTWLSPNTARSDLGYLSFKLLALPHNPKAIYIETIRHSATKKLLKEQKFEPHAKLQIWNNFNQQ